MSATSTLLNERIGGKRIKFYRHDSYPKGSNGRYGRSVIFKFGDLIQRAIKYKEANKSKDVIINMAVYKIQQDVAIDIDPTSKYYGRVKIHNAHGDGFWSIDELCKLAGDKGVQVRILYNMDSIKSASETSTSWKKDTTLAGKSHKTCIIRKVQWNPYNRDQMHNKFLTVNYYSGGSSTMRNTVYVSTSNIDHETYLGNTGVLINHHDGLYEAYNNYFQIIWENASNITSFRKAMTAAHQKTGGLNFDDGTFSAFFYPTPPIRSDAWDTTYNAVAKAVAGLDKSKKNWIKINMWHFKKDSFGARLISEMNDLPNASIKVAYSKDSSEKLYDYAVSTKKMISLHGNNGQRNSTGNTSGIKLVNYRDHGGSHAKNFMFTTHVGGKWKYWIITGSTNIKAGSFKTKGNNQLMIRSSSRELYDLFGGAFDNYYSYPNSHLVHHSDG